MKRRKPCTGRGLFVGAASLLFGCFAAVAPTPAAAQLDKCVRGPCTQAEAAAALAMMPVTVQDYLQRGALLLGLKRYDEAIDAFSQVHRLEPNNALALGDRALAHAWKREYDAANKDVDAALAIDPRSSMAFTARGLIAEQKGAYRDAVTAYRMALEFRPNEPFVIGQLAMADMRAGDDDAALRDAATAIGLSVRTSDMQFMRASIFMKRHRTDLAMAEAEAAVAAKPEDPSAYIVAARIYLLADQRSEALRALDRSLAIKASAGAYALRSTARPPADRAARQEDIGAALKLDPKFGLALVEQAKLQQELGNRGAAPATLTPAAANMTVLYERAKSYRLAGDIDRALEDSAAVIAKDPRMVPAYLLRANLLRQKGRTAEALAVAAAVEAANAGDPYAHVVAAKIYGAYSLNPDAMRAYDRALAIRPEAYMYLNRSETRPKTDVAGREADIEAAYALDPAMREVVVAKARLQTERGDFAQAVETFGKALAATPDDVDLLQGRGMVYARTRDMSRAESDFAAARAKATNAGVLDRLCWQKATAGLALESALQDCNAALSKDPDSFAARESRGLTLLRLGRFDEAIADFDRALAKAQTAVSMYGRAIARARKGDKTGSEADQAVALKFNPRIPTVFQGYGIIL